MTISTCSFSQLEHEVDLHGAYQVGMKHMAAHYWEVPDMLVILCKEEPASLCGMIHAVALLRVWKGQASLVYT